MSVPTTAWSETAPAGTEAKSLGDNRIRELKTQLREVITVDHEMDSSGQDTDWGYHNQCTFLEAADIGTGASGIPILGAQTVSGKPELTYTDENDNDVQITDGGKLSIAGGALTDAQILVGNGSDVATDVAVSGNISLANTGAMTFQISGEAAGDVIYNNAGTWDTLAKGTAYQKLSMNTGATAPEWVAEVGVYDYTTSASASTQKRQSALKIAYGTISIAAAGNQAISNLPFTSATSYVVTLTFDNAAITSATGGSLSYQQSSGSAFTINNGTNVTGTIGWQAIGT